MDRSFQSPSFLTASQSGRPSMGGNSSFLGGRPNPLAKKASSRMSISARSNQSQQIIAKSNYNVVKSYGNSLPVLVTEALTFTDRNSEVTISVSPTEWAWAVCGRRLLVWQFRESRAGSPRLEGARRRGVAAQCRELTLPHCDIGHKSTLITVFQNEGQQMASCLAVSATGDVRYWPSVAHDGLSIDETIGWEGQEFSELISIPSMGYLLGTTTCNLVLLQVQLVGGRHQIVHKNIKPPSGFFGGIGKKFASIIIGMHSSPDKENKLIKMCVETVSGPNDKKYFVSVLSESFVQRWLIASNANETFLYEDHDLLRKIKDRFHAKLWSSHDISGIEIWLLDMQQYNQDVVVLAAAVNPRHTPQMHYALVTLADAGDTFTIKNFHSMAHTAFHNRADEPALLSLRFILNRSYAFVYSGNVIYPVLFNESASEEVDKLEFYGQGDKILTGTINRHNLPVFFSKNYGHVCITAADFEPDMLNSSISSDTFFSHRSTGPDSMALNHSMSTTTLQNINLSMYEMDPDEIRQEGDELTDQMKAAFIFYLKGQVNSCTTILNEAFPVDSLQPENDTALDLTVYQIATDLAEDIPAADPRWEPESESRQKHALGSSTSLQIVQQLKEKSLSLIHFVEFLHAVKLWDRLKAITIRDTIKHTSCLLMDINEKIVVATALKCLHSNYAKTMDMAIDYVLEQRKEHPTGSLTAQDLFYVKVTRVQDIFKVFGELVETQVKSGHSNAMINGILEVNTILLTVLSEVLKFRESQGMLYRSTSEQANKYENLPWTTMSGKNGIRDVLVQMIQITLKYGIRGTGEPEIKFKFYQQMVELIDFVLDGKRKYLEGVKGSDKYAVIQRQYESQRSDLIYPLVEDEQYEMAVKLAEKYHDFQTLVVVCDRTANQAKLDEYIERYKEFDFSQIAINWHLRQNKRADLFERFKHNQMALGRFLVDHPSLAWLQLVFNGELENAGKILIELADNETELVARKKSMLSLAKLAFIATREHKQTIERINRELNLIEYQAGLRDELLQAFGFDVLQQKPFSADEIIDLLIAEENEWANEEDYRRALELLPYVENVLETRHRIWCSAILRDSWTSFDVNNAEQKMESMVFFKLIECCYLLDGHINDTLPPIEAFLSAPELGSLIEDRTFQYLLKLGYEQLKNYE